jgi:DNA polymerase-3 subunit gamma/tau
MLLYDEINAKGFEGDTLLEGFAEFLRNLLVSKDPKAAILLEVADDFKQRYAEGSKKIAGGWLVAALNLINQAEINYKQARNKRLHVELAIIKLSYLQQAIELVESEGTVSKKKVVESAKPVAFRAVRKISVGSGQLAVGSGQLAVDSQKSGVGSLESKEAKLIIESGPKSKIENPKSEIPATKSSASLASLQKIRQKVSDQHKLNGNSVKQLTEEEMYLAWGSFIEKLVAKKNHSAVTNFRAAKLLVTDNNAINIVTDSLIQQKFIENERAALIDHLQDHFCNKQLTYSFTIAEKEKSDEPVERMLNTKEQYLRIIEEYPLVKELKDRLRLELDY